MWLIYLVKDIRNSLLISTVILTDGEPLDWLSGSLSEWCGAVVSDLRSHHVFSIKREGKADSSALRYNIVTVSSTNQREDFNKSIQEKI